MRDRRGREIDYVRISITDRCNLRCAYCMPAQPAFLPDVLEFPEILRIARAAAALGVRRFRVTGGEPLARAGAAAFIAQLKRVPGVERVLLTTNGTLLSDALPALADAGIDGINIGLNAVDAAVYENIAGADRAGDVLDAMRDAAGRGIPTKVNAVLLWENADQILPLAQLARELPVDVRFIELMPIGRARDLSGPNCAFARAKLLEHFPDLRPAGGARGAGPAVYEQSGGLRGRIGFIAANSRPFCALCNRVRLTADGRLKPCLCYDDAVDLRALVRGGAADAEIRATIAAAIDRKPDAHCFAGPDGAPETRGMHSIGG